MKFYRKGTKLLFAITFLSLTTLDAFSISLNNPLKIRSDRGGRLINYVIKAKKVEQSGRKVQFRGTCSSACTMYLSLPRSQTCIARGAKFKFHMPYGGSAKANQAAANFMMRSYPSWVSSWIRRNGGLTSRFKTMNYSYASRYLQTCEVRFAKRRIKPRTQRAFSFGKAKLKIGYYESMRKQTGR